MRQQRRERDQAKWRSRIFGAEDFSGSFEIPERVGIKSRIDQKRVARFWHSIPFHLEHLSPKIQGRWKWYASPHQLGILGRLFAIDCSKRAAAGLATRAPPLRASDPRFKSAKGLGLGH